MFSCKSLAYKLLCGFLFMGWVDVRAQAPEASIQTTPGELENNAVCQNTTVTFTSISADVLDSADYQWLFGFGAFPFQAEGPGPHDVVFTEDGPRTVVLLVDNLNGTAPSAAQVDFDVVASLVPEIGGPEGSVCLGAAFALHDATEQGQSGLLAECGDSLQRFWSIASDLTFIVESGELGNANGGLGNDYVCGMWEPGSESLEVSVQESGTFEAWLYIGSSCGYDSVLYSCEVIAPGAVDIDGDAWVASEIEVCSGDSIGAFDLLSTSQGDSLFWELDVPNAVNGVGILSGSGLAPIAIPSWTFTNNSISPKTVELVISQGCSAQQQLYSIEVQPDISIFLGPSNLSDTLCSGESLFVLVNTTVHDVYIEWEADAASLVEGGNDGSSNGGPVIVDQLVNSTDSLQSLTYTFTTPTEACPAEPFDFAFTVVPDFSLPEPFDSLAVCPGDSVSIPAYSVALDQVQYTWNVEGDDIGIEPSGEGYVEAFAAENESDDQHSATVMLHADVLGCSDETSIHVVVLPRPVLSISTDSNAICSNHPFEATLNSTLSDAEIVWEGVFASNAMVGSAGAGYPPLQVVDTLVNASNEPDTVLYTFTVPDHACPSEPVVWSVPVVPLLELPMLEDATVCPGELVELSDAGLGIDSVLYNWAIVEGGDVGLPVQGDSLLTHWVADTESSAEPVTAFIEITAVLDGCCDTTGLVVTVHPVPELLLNGLDSLYCSGDSMFVEIGETTGTGAVWWSATADSTLDGFAPGSGDSLVHVLSNLGTQRDSIAYTFGVDGTVCAADTVHVVVEVWPDFSLDSLPLLAWCNGDSAFIEGYAPEAEGTQLTWINSNPTIGLPAAGEGSLPHWQVVNNSDTAALATLSLTASLVTCPTEQLEVECAIHPTPVLLSNVGPNGGLDCQTGTAFIEGFASTGAGQFTFTGPSVVTEQGSVAEVVASGTYEMDFVDGATGCSALMEVFVAEPVPVEIVDQWVDSLVCYGIDDAVIGLDAGGGADLLYQWAPAVSTGAVAENLGPGTYDVVVINASNCEESATFVLDPIAPIVVSLTDMGPALCGVSNGYLEVEATGGSGGFSYTWPEAIGAYWWGAPAGTHVLEVMDASNCVVDTAFTLACEDEIPVGVNQLLTPNGDGKNDRWVLEDLYLYPDHRVRVYNRWGALVYEASPYNNDWFGTWESGNGAGQPLPSATYYYLFDSGMASVLPSRGFIEIQNEAR
jgi:gliding motility-associated-like protein